MRGKPKLIKLTDALGNLKSPYWFIQYYGPDSKGRKRSQRVSTRYAIGQEDHKANLALAAFTLEQSRPKSKEPSQLMIAQALTDYYEEHIQHTASKKNAPYYEAKLNAFWGLMAVSDITQGKINEFCRELAGMSNGTVRRFLEHLQGALNWAEAEQRLRYVPKFKKPPPPAPRGRVFTPEEVADIRAMAPSPHIKLFIDIMQRTGQRPGAVESLKWAQVDFRERIIHFDRTGRRQTNKRVRPVAMSASLYDILKAAKKLAKTDYVLEYKGEPAGCVRIAFERACKAAKVKGSRYVIRHTFADEMDSAGVDEKITSDIAGHTNTKTTREHYIKTKMHKQREVLDLMDEVRKFSATATKKKGAK
jgi:integrase